MADTITAPQPATPRVSSAQSVGDSLESKMFGPAQENPQKVEAPETAAKIETPSPEPVASEQLKTDEPSDELKTLLESKKQADMPGAEKRKAEIQKEIDALTAQKKALLAEVGAIKTKEPEPQGKSQTTEKEFTNEELASALKKFMDEGDMQGVMDVMEYKNEQTAKKLRQEYEGREKFKIEQIQKQQAEWQSVVKQYSDYEDEGLKNDPDFDIRNQKSKLFQLAKVLYEDADLFKTFYKGDGGMNSAVKDAFTELLKQKYTGKLKTNQEPKPVDNALKNRLEKEQRKSSLGDGSDAPDAPKAPREVNELMDAIRERKAFQRARSRGTSM